MEYCKRFATYLLKHSKFYADFEYLLSIKRAQAIKTLINRSGPKGTDFELFLFRFEKTYYILFKHL